MRLMTWLPDFAIPSRDSLMEAAVVLGRLAGMPLSDVRRLPAERGRRDEVRLRGRPGLRRPPGGLPADGVSEWLEAAERVNARLAGEQRYG